MNTKDKIKNLIKENDVCLFMKGTPDAPQCGFSMAVCNMLKILEVNFKGVNVLENNSVHYDELGTVNDNQLIINDKSKVSIDDLIKSHTIWLTNYMSK